MSWEPTVNVDARQVLANIAWLQKSSNQTIAPVLKSNAYGHGLDEMVRMFDDSNLKIPFIAVAGPRDALRASEFTKIPVLCMGPATADELAEMRAAGVICSLTSEEVARIWWDQPEKSRPQAHLLLDTGLGRLGIDPLVIEETIIPELAQRGLSVHGLFNHPASADTGEVASVEQETAVALKLASHMTGKGVLVGPTHLGASSTLFLDQSVRGDITRLGIGMFGYLQDFFSEKGGIHPALTVTARVVHVKDIGEGETFGYSHERSLPKAGRVATINFGVCHGLNPKAENKWEVEVGGEPCRVLESTLDYSIIGPVPPGTQVGYDVLVMGGEGQYSVDHHAKMLGVIPDHVLAALSAIVVRRVHQPSSSPDGGHP